MPGSSCKVRGRFLDPRLVMKDIPGPIVVGVMDIPWSICKGG